MKWFVFIIGFMLMLSCGQKSNNTKMETEAETQTEETSEPLKLPGLAPVDIYLNMENQGFTTEKNLGGEYGSSWICKNVSGGINYEVSIFSTSTMDVESVTATAMNTDGDPAASLSFIKYVSSTPVDGVDRDAVLSWIEKNFNTDKAEYESGDVRYTISAPTKFLRGVNIMNKGRRG